MSEHAGMPVEEGEKYAFNLWFKECNSKMLYKDFNPDYYAPVISPTNGIIIRKSCVDDTTISRLLSDCNFRESRRRDGWVNLDSFTDLILKIEDVTGITRDFYENINVVEYKQDVLHDRHLTAYDMNTDTGKKYTAKLGQRTHAITIILNDNISINFPRIATDYKYEKCESQISGVDARDYFPLVLKFSGGPKICPLGARDLLKSQMDRTGYVTPRLIWPDLCLKLCLKKF